MAAGLELDFDRRFFARSDLDALTDAAETRDAYFHEVAARAYRVEAEGAVGIDVDSHGEVGNAGGREDEVVVVGGGDSAAQAAGLAVGLRRSARSREECGQHHGEECDEAGGTERTKG